MSSKMKEAQPQKRKERFSPLLKQAFVVFGTSLNITGNGCAIGYAAILLPQLRRADSPIEITDDSASWIASILGIAILIGNIISPCIFERFGRKKCHLLATLPMFTGWFLILASQNIYMILVARVLQGLAMGILTPVVPIIIGEYTSPKNRGGFLATITLSLATGMLFVHTVGSFLAWKTTAVVCSLLAMSAFVIILLSPETPSWLASKGRFEESAKSFYWLRGTKSKELTELEILINSQATATKPCEKSNSQISGKTTIKSKFNELRSTLMKKEFYKPLIIMINLFIMFHFAGTNVIPAYTIDILKVILGEKADVFTAMLAIDIVRLCTASLACVLIKKFNRRTILFTSSFLAISSLVSLASYLYLKSIGYFVFNHNLIPVGISVLYVFSLSSGIIPIPWVIAGEIYPLAYKGLGSCIGGTVLSIMFFSALKSAPYMFKSIGVHGAFLVYAGVIFVCSLNLFFLLPETKGKTLYEIEEHFIYGAIKDIEMVDFEREKEKGMCLLEASKSKVSDTKLL